MHDLIEAIKAWPVIIQGALGSALFWLVLAGGQKLFLFVSKQFSHVSKQARRSWLISARMKYQGAVADTEIGQIAGATMLVYRASRHTLRALMWLTLGLMFESFLSPIGIIGYGGCLYYLFRAYGVVSPIDSDEDLTAALEKVNAEYAELEKI